MTPGDIVNSLPCFGSDASIIDHLPTGAGGSSYLVADGGDAYVLRVDNDLPRQLMLDRVAESVILAGVALHELGPVPVYVDYERAIRVTRYIEGHTWSAREFLEIHKLAQLGNLLSRVHAIRLDAPSFNLTGRIERYVSLINTPAARDFARQIQEVIATVQTPLNDRCLCHNDLVGSNIIDNGLGLKLIDWEFAAIGDPNFDLAIVAEHHDLEEREVMALLAAYGVDNAGQYLEVLEPYRRAYPLLVELWDMTVDACAKTAAQ
ncbi:MAG: choline kinase family protein [Gammaproteobacteria bacterium]|nr:choline kinase family protein [Gammaproteobacteria bacterium]